MSIAIIEKKTPRPQVRIRALSASQLDSQIIDQWEQLEDRAVEPNPFMSPHFVLPAIRHLTPEMDVIFLLFEFQTELTSELAGLGIFELSRGTRVVPFPHLSAYDTQSDTFLTNMLVDRSYSREVLTTFFEFVVDQRDSGQCVAFLQRSLDSTFGRELTEIADQFGMRWIGWEFDRPILRPRVTTPEQVDGFLSRKRRQNIRRLKRQLESLGEVTFDIVRCGADMKEYSDHFLRLEHLGWKGAGNSSLKSHPESEAFFYEMTAGFAKANRMIFSELRVDEKVIASTSNFIAGTAGFGFKLGWDPAYRQYSPGVLQKIEFAKACNRELNDLDYFDSGCDMNSFVESLWPSKRKITSGAFVSSSFSKLAVAGMLQLRYLKRKIKHLISSC